MKIVFATLMLLLGAAVPAAAQGGPAPGNLGGGQVGAGAVELPRLPSSGSPNAAGAGSNAATAATTGSAASGSGSNSIAPAAAGSGSGGRGGGSGGMLQTLCLPATGSVSTARPEFGLSCPQ
ncbi:MAG TPA: hypothetical protein VFW46_00245 [Stellaceae bacterium]|nr:hypothetical protein [Stellaceae bacterium]